MSLLRVFPRRTSYTPDDDLAVVGPPGLFLPKGITEVHVSCVFTWDQERCRRLAVLWEEALGVKALAGGPGFRDLPGEFEPGRYVKRGVTFTSRGCPNKCSWCMVRDVEGPLRELKIREGNILQDNSLFACSQRHFKKVCEMLDAQPRAAIFAGGLDARRVQDWHFDALRRLRIREVYLASDQPYVSLAVIDFITRLREFLPRYKVRCYALVGFGGEDPKCAEEKLEQLWELGALPFAQYFQPLSAKGKVEPGPEWKDLVRKWSRPAAMTAAHKGQGPKPPPSPGSA